jgi:uncharacterized repeat protein (TIGR01451 family)
MRSSRGLALLTSCIVTCFTGHATAAGAASPLLSVMSASLVTQVDGHEELRSADASRPGDLLQYTLRYTNASARPLQGIVATLPVPPQGMSFVPGTALPAVIEASLDGRNYAPVPLMRIVRLPDGTERQQEVPAQEYRFLRWNIGTLQPGATVVVHARMRVNP